MILTSRMSAGLRRDAVRGRLAAGAAALVVTGAGLALRSTAAGDVAEYGGDALYTLLVLALVLLAAPRTARLWACAVALALSWGVEFLQLTGLPAELSRRSTAARWVLGSTFDAPDLLWYTVGAACGRLVLMVLEAARRRAASLAVPIEFR